MTRHLRNSPASTLTVFLALSLCSLAARAQAPGLTAPPPKPTLQTDLIAQLDDAQKKVMALEGAVPQAKFTWRPAPGVRSIAEAYMHIAYGNYGLTKLATGKVPPDDAGWEGDRDKWDKRTTDKAEIKKTLEKSFDHARAAIKAISEKDLEKKVDLFGTEVTARYVLITLIGHVNEHLGQSVAYARANKIVPPWSKEKDKEKK